VLVFKNYVIEIMSKSPSRRAVRLLGKLKLTEKGKKYTFPSFIIFFNVPMYYSIS
jgi:hypothetical protein